MTNDDAALAMLLRAVIVGDVPAAAQLIAASPAIVNGRLKRGATRDDATTHFHKEINHYLYAGDTALHAAADGHRADLVQLFNTGGARTSARQRRGP